MIVFTLADEDRRLAISTAEMRNRGKVLNGVATKKISAVHSDLEIHILGMMAEVAVCRLLGVEPDVELCLRGDAGYDLVWGGMTWDVKMRLGRFRDLMMRADLSDFRSDGAILCWADDMAGDVCIVGLVLRARFVAQARDDLVRERLVLPWRLLTEIR